ncbi:MAG TPA: hypothetical protein ENK04_14305 [Gammaproteobacteria bacterium]|nr:hypothetical protein [Gammaproteobacteria bacterium]
MKNKLRCMALLFAGLLFATPVLAVMGQNSIPPKGAYDGVLVKFKAGVSQTRMNRAFRAAGSQQHRSFRSRLVRGLTRAKIGRGNSLSATLRSLRNNRDVEFAEPNYILHTYAIPNDSRFDSLWGMHNTGQTGGVTDADIDAPEAWDLQTGSDVIIAIVDTGVDYNHSELSNNIWNNSAEIANNGRDDDGNGFVDDVRGWDFANNDSNPMDDNDHGTHLAGTIAASGNNGSGVAGVNWSARIMPLKFMDSTGAGSSADAIAAIDYAVANGARVINASWGGGPFSSAMFNAISAANDAGVLFVAAAGNESNNNDRTPSYPADYDLPNVISVAATDDADTLAGFSNFGANSVDLGAPGVSILSTVRNNGYASFNGTSMAAPHVTGVAALVIADNPNIGIPALRAALLDNTDAVADLAGRTVTGGRLNAFKALGGGTTPPPPPTPVVTVTPDNTSVIVGDSVQFSASGGSAPYVWSVADTAVGSISANGNFTGLAVGVTRVSATDANGVRSNEATVTVSDTAVISISPNTASLRVGESVTFSASGGNAPYSWVSNSPGVATINASTGVLTAQNTGSTTVTVTDNSGNTANSGAITVTAPPPPVAVTVSPNTGSVAVGATLQFSASGGSAPYSWSVSNDSVARIDSNGVLTGRAAGSVIVTARDANGAIGNSGDITVTANNGGGRKGHGHRRGGMMGGGMMGGR